MCVMIYSGELGKYVVIPSIKYKVDKYNVLCLCVLEDNEHHSSPSMTHSREKGVKITHSTPQDTATVPRDKPTQ